MDCSKVTTENNLMSTNLHDQDNKKAKRLQRRLEAVETECHRVSLAWMPWGIGLCLICVEESKNHRKEHSAVKLPPVPPSDGGGAGIEMSSKTLPARIVGRRAGPRW